MALPDGEGGGRVETISVAPQSDGPHVDEDCVLFKSAIELLETDQSSVAFDRELSDWADRELAPGYALVVVHQRRMITIFSSVSDGPETRDYCRLLEMAIDTLRNPDGPIVPDQ